MVRDLVKLASEETTRKLVDRDNLYDDVPETQRNGFYSEYYLDARTFFIELTCGETAFCKWKGLQFPIDYGKSPHTVITAPQGASDLVLRTIDPVRAYWLVTGAQGNYQICGWIWGHEARSHKYWVDDLPNDPAAYFVPNSELYDPEDWRDD